MFRHHRPALTLVELLVVLAIIALLVGLTLPAVQKVRAAADRLQCKSHLKQLTLAAHHFHEVNGALPPGCSYQNGLSGQPHMSWLSRLLPFLEQEPTWQNALQAYARDRFFLTPPHFPNLERVVKLFGCPSDPRARSAFDFQAFRVAFTSYLGVWGTDHRRTDGVLFLDSAVRLTDVTDGTTNTLMIGERPPSSDHNLGWWYAGWGQSKDGSAEMVLGVREINASARYQGHCPPGPYRFAPGADNNVCDAFHFWSRHAGGANFAFCDGSVRFLSYGANDVLPALASRTGGEAVEVP